MRKLAVALLVTIGLLISLIGGPFMVLDTILNALENLAGICEIKPGVGQFQIKVVNFALGRRSKDISERYKNPYKGYTGLSKRPQTF